MKRVIIVLLSVLSGQLSVLAQGPLPPPGPPTPTMKTLQQVEPRTLISSLPYTITASGSYYLTTNLTCTGCSNGVNGITVQADGVTIDLNGFLLSGVPTSGSGIHGPPNYASVRSLAVRNGAISGWGASGVGADANDSRCEHLLVFGNSGGGLGLGDACVVEDCVAGNNGSDGIVLLNAGLLTRCVARGNGGTGIFLTYPATASDCVAYGNGSDGINGDFEVVITRCTASHNQGNGIAAAVSSGGIGGAVISDCEVSDNDLRGIYAGDGSTVHGCAAYHNYRDGISVGAAGTVVDCTSFNNRTNGIVAGIGCTIRGCTSRNNGADGILVPNDCVVADNNCTANGAATTTGAGIHTTSRGNRIEGNALILNKYGIRAELDSNLIIKNSARANTTNYFLAAANTIGPTNNLVGADYTLTNQNPWANFSY